MSLFALASTKGSPGVTTLCQALAHSWPADHRVLLVEADPSGGDLAARLELPVEPGLASLAAAGRRGLSADVVLDHVQPVAEHATLLVGPPSARLARGALELLGDQLVSALAQVSGSDALIDVGRLDADSPSATLARTAGLLVLVARPTVAEIAHLAPQVEELRNDGCAVSLLLVGESGPSARHLYPADEVTAAVGIRPLATVADDGRTAAVLAGYRRGERLLARSELLRSARHVGAVLLEAASAAQPGANVPDLTSTSTTPTLTLAPAGDGGGR